jgi:ABC-2 type transport system permease protein
MSAFSEDVRGAQALIGHVYPIIFIPALALLYLDINTLPSFLKAVFYAIPYSHPIIAAEAVVLGDYSTVVFGIAYVAAFTIVIMYVASSFLRRKNTYRKIKLGKAYTLSITRLTDLSISPSVGGEETKGHSYQHANKY